MKIGSITVIGGGISGIQAALDMADSGFKVYLVEEKPGIGGVMSQLDKTFPTNDCSSCMMGPKLVEMANHPDIELLTYTDVIGITGDPGNFRLQLKKKARAVDEEKCVGCGICADKCPVKIPNTFNLGLNERRAVYLLYPQVVPLVYTVDKEHCRFFTQGKCRICEKLCKNNAIKFDQEDELLELDTGAVILAGGVEPYNASLKKEYGHGRWPNVLTSLEYERMLSAAGPFQGHIRRISDGKAPRSIAWIQCIGSRDANIMREYCSSVCCMYATKQAMITREHDRNISTTIFYIDIRAQGKGFDRFYERAKNENFVRYIRAMISRVIPNPEDDSLNITYATQDNYISHETFDLVVLSVGLCANRSAAGPARILGLDPDDYGFCRSAPLDMTASSRPGVFLCGGIQGPKDIPESVQQGSAAAAGATALVSEARGTLVASPEKPAERDVSQEAPRIGVFVCHCGINIAGVVDVAEVSEYALTLPDVVHASHCMFACSTDQQHEIRRIIDEERLNRIVVASCTPRTHEPLFRNTLRDAGLNPYLFELANIREHDSWVHQNEPEQATEKAKDLVRMSVSRARHLEPLYEMNYPVTQSALVIGGGLSGLTAALSVAEQGFPAVLIERTGELGGNARNLYFNEEGAEPFKHVESIIEQVENNPLITVYKRAKVESMSGSCGAFVTKIFTDGQIREINHGVVVAAVGGEEYKPEEYLYGTHPRVVTQKEFEAMLIQRPDEARSLQNVVMIQCVGSREPENQYCSRVCCTAAVKNSIKMKELNPEAWISVLYRDIRTFGLKEIRYLEARKKGVRFFRFESEQKPDVKTNEDEDLVVTVFDANLQGQVRLKADLLVLSAAIRPREEGKALAETLRLPLDEDGFFLEAHLKLRPLDFAVAGIFMAGLAHGPKFADESIAQARGAASRAVRVLSKKELTADAVITHINPDLCRACGECEKTCMFEAVKVEETDAGRKLARVAEALCTGCGACNAACPTGAASLHHFRDSQVNAMIRACA